MPILISTPQDLNNVRNNLLGDYELVNDIDMASFENFAPIGKNSTTFFKGTFDGKGFKIKNLTINETTGYVGLFGFLNNSTTIIKNVGLENCNISGGSVSNWVGGICGQLMNGLIENCYSTGQIVGKYMVGGIVGQFIGGSIKNCYSTSNITGFSRCGGLVGYIASSSAKVENSYSTGKVITTESGTAYPAGGLIGDNSATGNITNSFWDIETSELTISEGGTGLTTEQMKNQSSYTNWDFTSTWGINSNYPYLQVFGVPAAPPKIETINVNSFTNKINSTIKKRTKTTKKNDSFIDAIQTLSERHIATLRTVDTYTLPINSSVTKSTRTVRSATATVTSFINPLSATVQSKFKTMKQLLSFVSPLISGVNVIYPTDNKMYRATTIILENPSNMSIQENVSTTNYIENPSFVEVIE